MTPEINNKIKVFLHSEEALKILHSEEFYFQKGHDTLSSFLNYELTEEVKEYLIQNIKEYDELKESFENRIELQEFGRLLFTVISYCDSKSYRKNEFNQYPDKRVLALAYVRMNNWVEQLLSYKLGLFIPDGSVKNAIEYLLNPEENFTMLSENHREQLSENLFKKKYNKAIFKDDVFNYYAALNLHPNNSQNYSHLLSRFCYQIDTEWKQNVIGLISPDRTGWQQDAIEDTKDGGYIALWNHKRPNGTKGTLKNLRQCIDDEGHFKIFYTSNYNVIYVAEIIDFVLNQQELQNAKWLDKFGDVKWYSNDFGGYHDDKKNASWIYLAKRIYEVNPNDYSDFKYYKTYGYPSVGGQAPVVSYTNNSEKKEHTQMSNYKNLLQYKRQIILQGPPGTGKTKVAKEIAEDLMEENFEKGSFVDDDFLTIRVNDVLKTPFDASLFSITEVKRKEQFFLVKPYHAKNSYKVTYEQIYKYLNARGWNDGSDKWNHSGNGPYLVAIAKKIVELKRREIKERCYGIIQFHPSYTYEDFVRGIIAKQSDEGEGIVYSVENKTLAKFAKLALENYEAAHAEPINETNDSNVFEAFIEEIKDRIAQSENHKYAITEAVYLFSADETRFKYKGDNWVAHHKGLNMKFSELKKIIDSGANERQDIKKMSGIEELTRQHASYFMKVIEKYHQFRDTQPIINSVSKKVSLQNYVLVVDEINRANLSSVLGELIYALEYRGKEVDSMYSYGVDESSKIILPSNLYIIGTMNTADRSVGHIDYAIRRRFAFVNILPEKLQEDNKIYFNTNGYEAVEKLFAKNFISSEFEINDIQIGHSYFIAKKEDAKNETERDAIFKMKMDYEIKPILREYLKDGIFRQDKMIDIHKIEDYIEQL